MKKIVALSLSITFSLLFSSCTSNNVSSAGSAKSISNPNSLSNYSAEFNNENSASASSELANKQDKIELTLANGTNQREVGLGEVYHGWTVDSFNTRKNAESIGEGAAFGARFSGDNMLTGTLTYDLDFQLLPFISFIPDENSLAKIPLTLDFYNFLSSSNETAEHFSIRITEEVIDMLAADDISGSMDNITIQVTELDSYCLIDGDFKLELTIASIVNHAAN